MRPNPVLRKLRDGRPTVGTFLGLGSPLAAEQLGHLGFDWLLIDQEHHGIDATLTQVLLQVISGTAAAPFVRVPWKEPVWIRRALDSGAYGVLVPMVNTKEDAERVVSAARFPPLGARGIGGSRTMLYGGPDYVEHADEEIAVIVQIEHVRAVENAGEILGVPGIDGYFVGPTDLCASMGLSPTWDPRYPEYLDALARVRRVAEDLGVPGGIHTSPDRMEETVGLGYTFIAVGYDISFMTGGAAEAVRAARRAVGEDP